MKATQELVNDILVHIKKKHPDSHSNGLRLNRDKPKDTPLVYIDNADFLNQVRRSQIWVEWAKGFGLRKTINTFNSSYGIKHAIEKNEMSEGYVCNMAAIVALLIEKVTITDDYNPRTNLSKKVFKERNS